METTSTIMNNSLPTFDNLQSLSRPIVYVPSQYSLSAATFSAVPASLDVSSCARNAKRKRESSDDDNSHNVEELRTSLLQLCIIKLDTGHQTSSVRPSCHRRMSLRQSVLIYNMLRGLEASDPARSPPATVSTPTIAKAMMARNVLDDENDSENDFALATAANFDLPESSTGSSDLDLESPLCQSLTPSPVVLPVVRSCCDTVPPISPPVLPKPSPASISATTTSSLSSCVLSADCLPSWLDPNWSVSDWDFDYEMSLFDFDYEPSFVVSPHRSPAITSSSSLLSSWKPSPVPTSTVTERSPLLTAMCSLRSELLCDDLDHLMQILVGS